MHLFSYYYHLIIIIIIRWTSAAEWLELLTNNHLLIYMAIVSWSFYIAKYTKHTQYNYVVLSSKMCENNTYKKYAIYLLQLLMLLANSPRRAFGKEKTFFGMV